MATTIDAPEAPGPGDPDTAGPGLRVGPLAGAGIASLGAGAVHAAAAGAHGDDAAVAMVFAALALAQLAWGAHAVVARSRSAAAFGALLGAGAVTGWVVTRTSGIGAIDGFADVGAVTWPDAIAATLALVSAAWAVRVLLAGDHRRPDPLAVTTTATIVAVAAFAGLATVGTHGHGDLATESHDHGGASESASGPVQPGHDHGAAPAVPPVTFDPDRPVDLSGVAGVDRAQQARAEQLVVDTLDRLPQFADHREAEALGYRSIGDGLTGHEHFVNWENIDDGRVLDPDHPESLVYEVGPDGDRELVAAMFMLAEGTRLDDVPDIGGPLTQWHVHDDLCFSDDPVAPRVVGVTSVGGSCPGAATKLDPMPMIHVWIAPHPCGPFSALDGVAAGQVAPGETHTCHEVHGS